MSLVSCICVIKNNWIYLSKKGKEWIENKWTSSEMKRSINKVIYLYVKSTNRDSIFDNISEPVVFPHTLQKDPRPEKSRMDALKEYLWSCMDWVYRYSGYSDKNYSDKKYQNLDTKNMEISFFPNYGVHTINPCLIPYRKGCTRYLALMRIEEKHYSEKLFFMGKTKNIMVLLDENYNPLENHDITLQIKDKNFISRNRNCLDDNDFILEDLRFMEGSSFNNDRILLTGVAMVEYKPSYKTKIALLELNVEKRILKFIRFLGMEQNAEIQKNWIFFKSKGQDGINCGKTSSKYNLSNKYYMIYKFGPPVEIFQSIHVANKFKLVKKIFFDLDFINLCKISDTDCPLHLSCLTETERHLIIFYHYYLIKNGRRVYENQAVLLDKESLELMGNTKMDMFVDLKYDIIYLMNVIRTEKEFIFVCGIDDTIGARISMTSEYFMNLFQAERSVPANLSVSTESDLIRKII